jgi:hypothetical protein
MSDPRAVARMHLTQMLRCQRKAEIAAARAMLATLRCAWSAALAEQQRAENFTAKAAKHQQAVWDYLMEPSE